MQLYHHGMFQAVWCLLCAALAVWAATSSAPAGPDVDTAAFFSPAQLQMRGQLATQMTAAAALPAELAASVQEAAKDFKVNDVDASEAVNTTVRSLLPWSEQPESIQLPQTGTVPQWLPLSKPDAPVELSVAEATTAEGVPPAASQGACCDKLSALGFRSNLPVVVIDTAGAVARLRKDVPATLCTCGARNGTDYEGSIMFRVRGSSSAVQMVKKSFGIKFTGAQGNGTGSRSGGKVDVPFLGMAAASDWALYGDDLDLTLGMRNALAYDVSQQMGRWAPGSTFVEVMLLQGGAALNAASYWGVYLAVEKIEIHPNRLPLKSLNAKSNDLSGGYVLGFERSLWPSDVRLVPSKWQGANAGANASCPSGDGRNLTYVLHEPSAKGANLEQQGLGPRSADSALVAWVSTYLGSVEAAVVQDKLPDTSLSIPSGAGGWRALVDEVAFIDYLLAQELPKNPDFGRGSVYMYLDQDKPLILGPSWDFNEAFGMCCGYPIEGYRDGGRSNGSSGGSAISPEGWRFNVCDEADRCKADPEDGISLWWRTVWNREPAFRKAVAQRWQLLRSGPLSDTFFQDRFLTYEQQLSFAAPRNFKRWHSVFGSDDDDSDWKQYSRKVVALYTWTRQRLAWLDRQLASVVAEVGDKADRPTLSGAQVKAVVAAVSACADATADAARAKATRSVAPSKQRRSQARVDTRAVEALQQMLAAP